jgi:hypothetical protein
VSTRRLILAALACGLAILVAGSIQLLRLASSDEAATVLGVGDSAVVDGIEVTLVSMPGDLALVVRMVASAEADSLLEPGRSWSMQVGDVRLEQRRPDVANIESCDQTSLLEAGETVECSLAFADATTDATRYLRFSQRGKTATWALAA